MEPATRSRGRAGADAKGGRKQSMMVLAMGFMVLWTIGSWTFFAQLGCSQNWWKSIRNEVSVSELDKLVPIQVISPNTEDVEELKKKLSDLEEMRQKFEDRELEIETKTHLLEEMKLKAQDDLKRFEGQLDALKKENSRMQQNIKKVVEQKVEASKLIGIKANGNTAPSANPPKQDLQQNVKGVEEVPVASPVIEEKLNSVAAPSKRALPDLVRYVDVRRGTDNRDFRSLSKGNALPILSRPFGMTHWAIENSGLTAWFFNPNNVNIGAIRCTHQPSPWIGDYGYFNILPIIDSQRDGRYANKEAIFNPSYMKFKLTSQCVGIDCTLVEFVATKHGGVMGVVFPKGLSVSRGVRFTQQASFEGSVDRINGKIEIRGMSVRSTVFKAPPTMHFHFVARIESGTDVPLEEVSVDQQQNIARWRGSEGTRELVIVRFGTSFISIDQARRNLEQETEGKAFSQLQKEGFDEWNSLLSRVSVEPDPSQSASDAEELKTMLYSCLYRGLLFPRQLGEIDSTGTEVHYSPYDSSGKTYPGPLSTDSGFWDAYRAVYPMLHLVYPDLASKVMEGWVNAIREDPNGMLVQWSSPGRVGSMVGSMGEVSMAEAIVNGALSKESVAVAYAYMKRSAMQVTPQGREHMSDYLRHGFVPGQSRRDSTVSLTLNYLLSDYSVSLAAEHLGDMDTARTLRERSGNWRKLFDSNKLFFREKNDRGEFKEPFDQYLWMGAYTEGGPWQYRFYVPHDPKGLREAYQKGSKTLRGTESTLCYHLKEMMTTQGHVSNRQKIHEELEMQQQSFGQYSHNNQPVHHVLYMFAAAGCALDGQQWIHHTLRTQYGPFGYAGDEDNGEMSSWYILSSLGLYALVPGSGKYQVGAPPLFKQVTIHRPAQLGGDLKIVREDIQVSPTPKNHFQPAKSVSWNGKKYSLVEDAVLLPYKDLLQGGTLVFSSN